MAQTLAPLTARRAGAAVAAFTAAAGLVALNRDLVGVFYDDGLYAGIAVALAGRLGYVHPHLPGAPAVVHYPPLYPLVLAPLFGSLTVPTAAFLGKVVNLVLAAATAGLIAWHATRTELLGSGVPRWVCPSVVAAAALAIPVLATQSVLFAEPLFGALLATAIVCADGTAPPGQSLRLRDAWLAGVAAALALLTRTIGVAAGGGIVLFLLLPRRAAWSRAFAAAAPVGLAALAWGIWVAAHHRGIDPQLAINYGSYAEVIRQAGLSAFGVSAPDLPRPLAAITLSWLPGGAVRSLFGMAALAVGCYGLALLARRSAIGFTIMMYLAILAVWPFPPDRFLWGILPWLALAWAAGAAALWQRARLRLVVMLLVGVVGAGYALYEARGFAGRWWAGAARDISANFTELLPWLDTLPRDAVLATDDESLVWLYTRRLAVPFYLERYRGREIVTPTPPELRMYLERQGVTHVLLASPRGGSAKQLRALLAEYPGWLTPVHGWPGGRWVYAVSRGR